MARPKKVVDEAASDIPKEKSKRGRKPKVVFSESTLNTPKCNISFEIQTEPNSFCSSEPPNLLVKHEDDLEKKTLHLSDAENEEVYVSDLEIKSTGPKKRGRKPKGGKIVQQLMPIFTAKETKSNVILHLKCSLKDLATNSSSTEVDTYNQKTTLAFEWLQSDRINKTYASAFQGDVDDEDDNDQDVAVCPTSSNQKEIWKKLKDLEQDLHINNVNNKKSNCHWDTCEFDNPPVYIPKFFLKNSYHVYGCFCSPECGVAFLMNEKLDTSTKFERYHLMNHLYGKIFNFTKGIKPAANPYYTLDKFFGNLTVQQYRSLLSNDRLFLILDKPLTRVLPEIHVDNDDFIINNKIIPSNTFNVKKKSTAKQTNKSSIVSEKFGHA